MIAAETGRQQEKFRNRRLTRRVSLCAGMTTIDPTIPLLPFLSSSWPSNGSAQVVAPFAFARVYLTTLWFLRTIGTARLRIGATLRKPTLQSLLRTLLLNLSLLNCTPCTPTPLPRNPPLEKCCGSVVCDVDLYTAVDVAVVVAEDYDSAS